MLQYVRKNQQPLLALMLGVGSLGSPVSTAIKSFFKSFFKSLGKSTHQSCRKRQQQWRGWRCSASVVLLAFGLTSTTMAQADTWYRHGYWFDGQRFVKRDQYVRDGLFSQATPTAASKVVDLTGHYVLPPFAEGHNHNLQNPFLQKRFAAQYQRDGILYGLMLGGDSASAKATRRMLQQQNNLDVLVSGVTVSSSDGHPLAMILQPGPDGKLAQAQQVIDKMFVAIDQPADLDNKWSLLLQNHPDIVKIMLVHSEDPSRRNNPAYYGRNGLDAALVAPLVEKFKASGVRVIAHTESAADFQTAVNAGVDAIAHLPGYHWWPGKTAADYRLADSAIAAAAKAKVAVMTTTSVSTLFAMPADQLAAVRSLQQDNLRRLKQAGVTLLAASDRFDANVLTEINYLDSLALFSRAELLQMLTQDTARFIFPNRNIGRLQNGYEASFVTVLANPLQDLSSLSQVQLRVRQGQLLKVPMTTAPASAPAE